MKQRQDPHVSRREALQAGLLAGIGAALPTRLLAADAALPLITKAIPSTGERLPVIGIGTDSWGDIDAGTAAATVRALLKRMVELGGAVVDTAGLYRGSEERIGPALTELNIRSKVFLSSKLNMVGAINDPPKPPVSRHGVDPLGGADSLNRSLRRLQTDKIDLMMVHWLSSVDAMVPVLVDLKKQGKVRYIGISTVVPAQQARLAGYMRKYPVDFVQVEYSLGDRTAEHEVFAVAMQKKIAVSVARPYYAADGNSMLGKIKGRPLPPWAADYDIASWGQFFLKYVVSHPIVTGAVSGTTNIAHLEDNLGAGRGRLPDAAGRKKMEAFWESMG
jgi:aryl-alcohol dehydrogenase-like predicted oxidoreductase